MRFRGRFYERVIIHPVSRDYAPAMVVIQEVLRRAGNPRYDVHVFTRDDAEWEPVQLLKPGTIDYEFCRKITRYDDDSSADSSAEEDDSAEEDEDGEGDEEGDVGAGWDGF